MLCYSKNQSSYAFTPRQNIFFYEIDPWWSKLESIFKCCTFLMPVLIRHLWQLKTVVFLHRSLIHAVLLSLCLHQKLLNRIGSRALAIISIYLIYAIKSFANSGKNYAKLYFKDLAMVNLLKVFIVVI